MYQKLLFLSLSFGLLISPALAASSVVVANLKTPVTEAKEELAGDFIWRCVGNTCAIVSEGGSASPSVCRSFVKQFGPVTSFGTAQKQLASADIDACNASVK